MLCFNCSQDYVPEGHTHHATSVCPKCKEAFDEMKKIREAINTLEKYANLEKFGEDRMLHHRIYSCFSNTVKEQFSITIKKFVKNFALYENSKDFIPAMTRITITIITPAIINFLWFFFKFFHQFFIYSLFIFI